MSEFKAPEIAVTNRHLCSCDFLEQLAKIAARQPDAILLREKDMLRGDYCKLARQCNEICLSYGVRLISHSHPVRGVEYFHVPYALIDAARASSHHFSVSVHSPGEARKSECMGAQFVIAGHIFETNCKPGKPPRGLEFLQAVCEAVKIPVYAIGGITEQTAKACISAGAAGICRMSYWMKIS